MTNVRHIVSSASTLPSLIAGPILRHVAKETVTLWFVTPTAADVEVVLYDSHKNVIEGNSTVTRVQVGERAYINLAVFTPTSNISPNHLYFYDLQFSDPTLNTGWHDQRRKLLYSNNSWLNFTWQTELTNVLHGSCRKPHFNGTDALIRVDQNISDSLAGTDARADMLIMSGDQIYADDVAGPMLQAIHQVIEQLGLFHEPLDSAMVENSKELVNHKFSYYQREQLLPQIDANSALSSMFFGAKKKPVFTSVHAQNHLISMAEILAMYILVWSDEPWQWVSLSSSIVAETFREQFKQEQVEIENFVHTLPQVRRALAHLPVYMIFDDHDVTDDWNLTRGWEAEVYGHPLSKRMVGNALIGYALCQGWGNQPEKFTPLIPELHATFQSSGLTEQDKLIDYLLNWSEWHYQLNTTPPVHVLDTRTQRWRSESSMNKPSGLMDWEALCEFQQSLINSKAVIVVSAAPIYGVKIIEMIQRIFTFFGKALTVDAENWMAHKGTANVMLNIFRHYKTPPQFIILSGDVHYSFVYDVRLRFRRNSPRITQFTCSGFKNGFPTTLLSWLDRLNQILYSPKSPLNLFTKRRNMTIYNRAPDHAPNTTLLNAAAVGQLNIDANCTNVVCKALCANGKTIEFPVYNSQPSTNMQAGEIINE